MRWNRSRRERSCTTPYGGCGQSWRQRKGLTWRGWTPARGPGRSGCETCPDEVLLTIERLAGEHGLQLLDLQDGSVYPPPARIVR